MLHCQSAAAVIRDPLQCAAASPTCLALLLCAATTMAGCSPTDRGSAEPAAPNEAAWNEQVAAVRAGASREITLLARPVTAAELLELAEGCGGLRVLEIDNCETNAK